jgi:hypothetical protein
MRELEQQLRRAFAEELGQHPDLGERPRLRVGVLVHSDYDRRVMLDFVFEPEMLEPWQAGPEGGAFAMREARYYRRLVEIDHRSRHRGLSQQSLVDFCQRLWDETCEDARMHREVARLRARRDEAYAARVTPEGEITPDSNLAFARAQQDLEDIERHALRHHTIEGRQRDEDERRRGVHESRTEHRIRIDAVHFTVGGVGGAGGGGGGGGGVGYVVHGGGGGGGGHSAEAEKKGRQLLLDHLTSEQRACFEKNGYFECIGSTTGKRYRIKTGRQMNVYELDDKGNQIVGRCFLPGGGLCEGDTMLAQKIAIECMEAEALKVANVFADKRTDAQRAAEPQYITWSQQDDITSWGAQPEPAAGILARLREAFS